MTNLRVRLSLLLSILVSGYIFAWGVTGHRVIAEIAENHLSRKSKREIKKLLGKEKRDIAVALYQCRTSGGF